MVGSGLVGVVVLEGIFLFFVPKLSGRLLSNVFGEGRGGGESMLQLCATLVGRKQTALRDDGRWSKMISSIPSITERLDNHVVNEGMRRNCNCVQQRKADLFLFF